MAPISQREARRLQKRVERLESILSSQRRRYVQTYPGGTNFYTLDLSNNMPAYYAVKTARLLGHAVVVVSDDSSYQVRLCGLPHPDVEIE